MKEDYQAEFSWHLYKKMSSGFKQNMVISPYSLRKIFACLQQLTNSSDPATSSFTKQLSQVFQLKQKDQLPDLVRQRYVSQWKAFEQETGLNTTTLAAVIGREKVTKEFNKLPGTCGAIFARPLFPGSPKQMSRTLNSMMKNFSKGAVKSFSSESDIDRDWDFFVADSWKFTGLWRYQFEEEHSTTCNFYTSATEKGLMRFMYLEERLKFGHFPEWNVRAVELPLHSGSPFSCILMMSIDGNIKPLINSLNHTRFQQIYSKMSASKTTVRLPQLRLKMKLAAKSMLRQLGFNAAFDKPVFHVFAKKSAVPLGDIIQKVDISIEHEGEQSAKIYRDRSLGNQFAAHQPFVFVVFERKELIPVILGHIVKAATPKDIGSASDERLCEHPPKY